MKADLTRDGFRPALHYSRVVHQQGRVALDADLNEQFQIDAHRDAVTSSDVIGPVGVPNGNSFSVTPSPGSGDLLLHRGHLYLDGLICEADASQVDVLGFPAANQVALSTLTIDETPLRAGGWVEIEAAGGTSATYRIHTIDPVSRSVTFAAGDDPAALFGTKKARLRRIHSYIVQPDDPKPSGTTWPSSGLPSLSLAAGTYIAYVDAWRRHVTALHDPNLREVALGGVDTCTRERTIWQLGLHQAGDLNATVSCADLPPAADNRGALSARAKQPDTGTHPCIIDPAARYRRLENQLYRVEVHEGGVLGADTGITFKFSRDNATVVSAWTGSTASELTVASPGKDSVLSFAAGQWVELIDDQRVLSGVAGTLVQIDKVVGQTLTMKPGTATGTTNIADFSGTALVRRWDQVSATGTLVLERPGTNDGYVHLEDGVEVRFEDGVYDTGDYWLVPARTITADVEWPRDLDGKPIARPRHGTEHHRAALAVVRWNGTALTVLEDCRPQFPPLTDICAKDVCVDNDPCGKGWETVQDALEDLCKDNDLEHHNKHLHGWGVVCGLRVICMDKARAARENIARPGDHVWLTNGYAIHPTGSDIIVNEPDVGDGDRTGKPVDLAELIVSEGLALRDSDGNLPDIAVSLWIDKDGSLHVDKYDTDQRFGWAQLLEGSIWADIYEHCIKNLIDLFREQVAPDDDKELVGPSRKRVITFLNLLWQLVNPESGRHIYLSGEKDPSTEGPNKEDRILREVFEKLKAQLQSDTFCAMFEGVEFPDYDVYRTDLPPELMHPSTIFGRGYHTRIRIHPDGRTAYTCGTGGNIHVYDLVGEKMLGVLPFPVSGAEVKDVAFNKAGTELYAIAWVGQAKADSVFAVGDIASDHTVRWPQNQVHCDLKLVTLATSESIPNRVFAAARGAGIFPFDPTALVPDPAPLATFRATGHLIAVERRRQTILYATANPDDPNPVTYDRVLGIPARGGETRTYTLPAGTQVPGGGRDDIAAAFVPNEQIDELYAVADGDGSNKRLVIWDPDQPGTPSRVVGLGENSAARLAFNQHSGCLFITYADRNVARAYRPRSKSLERAVHPLQIGPISVAVGLGGKAFFVLNWLSNTITVVPAFASDGSDGIAPCASTIALRRLIAYRKAVIAAFMALFGRFAQYLKDCVCDHLLVRCPTGEGKVYLADITVRDGAVYQICHFHTRKYVHTFPTVEYWMSLVPVIPLIKQAVERFCCKVLGDVVTAFGDRRVAAADSTSTNKLRIGVAHLQDMNLAQMFRARKSQLTLAGMLGKEMLARKLDYEPAGQPAAGMSAIDVTGRPAGEATEVAGARGVAVAEVTIDSGDDIMGTALRTAVAPPRLRAGDSIRLITDTDGRVISYGRARLPEPSPDGSRAEITELEAELATMNERYTAQAEEMKKMNKELKKLTAVVERLRRG